MFTNSFGELIENYHLKSFINYDFFYLPILLGGFLSSCAFHSGYVSSGSIVDCPMKTIVTGQASTSKFLGLGGLSKNALIVDASRTFTEK